MNDLRSIILLNARAEETLRQLEFEARLKKESDERLKASSAKRATKSEPRRDKSGRLVQ